ncbi:hypothetical protein PSU4_36270 [Pseudonocardia sulfidoxydans NBRC 16205]|uniref:Uncharacterized protein n=2 Tax=Pseudonocardia sulfidoxydans TaxID=54011 RepID=A0A511DK69_9PSEU|nr:hypothetical protein [Pseudonocardia sulfidoxydans]GEL24673.1 hypothetical protein PSU4_36270 [Pseudonocardia sulfidoxydans NBRC 16205]
MAIRKHAPQIKHCVPKPPSHCDDRDDDRRHGHHHHRRRHQHHDDPCGRRSKRDRHREHCGR